MCLRIVANNIHSKDFEDNHTDKANIQIDLIKDMYEDLSDIDKKLEEHLNNED